MAKKASALVNISEAKAQLSALVQRVQDGGEVLIGKSGAPVAKLVKFSSTDTPRVPGALKGKIKIGNDFDTLPDDIAQAFRISEDEPTP